MLPLDSSTLAALTGGSVEPLSGPGSVSHPNQQLIEEYLDLWFLRTLTELR